MSKEAIDRVLDQIRHFAEHYQAPAAGQLVLVAVSGGIDSLVLFDAFRRLQNELSIHLHVAHLDHMLRGEESALDAAHVAELAHQQGVPCTVEQVDIAGLLGSRSGGRQALARRERYAFLERLALGIGASWVATGHNRDDQAETVLWRVIRGTGLPGLGGIPSIRGRYLRPLLGLWREDIEHYAQAAGLLHREDASNLRSDYTRNRIRLEILPLLESINPEVKQALVKLSDLASQDQDYLEVAARAAYRQLRSYRWGQRRLHRKGLLSLHRALASRVLIRMVQETYPPFAAELDQASVERALQLVEGTTARTRVMWPGDAVLAVEADWVTLVLPHEPLPERLLQIPGVTPLGRGMYLTARILSRVPERLDAGHKCAYVDFDRIEGPLGVRPRRPRDRFRPLGMGGSKRLKDYLIEARIPTYARHRIPVVESDAGIVWLAGLRQDDRFRVRDDTQRVLQLGLREMPW